MGIAAFRRLLKNSTKVTFVWHRAGCSGVRCIKVALAIDRDGIARITGFGVFAPRADFRAANTRYYDSAYQSVLLKHNPVEANRLFDEVGWNSHDAAEAENADILWGAVCWWAVSWPVRQPVSRQRDPAISPHTTSSQVLDGPRNIQNPYAGFAPAFFLGALVFQIRSMRSQMDSAISAPCIATRFSTEAFSRFASTYSNQQAIKNYNGGYARNTILASAASAMHKQPRHRRMSGVAHSSARFFGLSGSRHFRLIYRAFRDTAWNAVMVASCCYRLSPWTFRRSYMRTVYAMIVPRAKSA
jgi:hypothetical protein